VRQIELLSRFCTVNGWQHEIIQDLGSGLNYGKKGLKEVIRKICHGEMNRLVVTYKDRLLRFGSELVLALCEIFNVEVVIINQGKELSYEEELAQDVLEIITVFSARLYGARSHKNKKIVQALREVADEVCR
jgi:putative resolvase